MRRRPPARARRSHVTTKSAATSNLILWLAGIIVALVSVMATTFAGVTWSRGEEREKRLHVVEKKQVGFEKDIKYIAEGVERLEKDRGTYPESAKRK
jgi:photosystem II stability/assembly factor-like uncharacterized protein